METEQRDRFVGIIRDEVGVMGAAGPHGDRIRRRPQGALAPGGHARCRPRPGGARRVEQKLGIPTKTEEVAEGLWVRVDSFSLLQGLTYLVFRLRDEYKIARSASGWRRRAAGAFRRDLERRLIDSQTLPTWEVDP